MTIPVLAFTDRLLDVLALGSVPKIRQAIVGRIADYVQCVQSERFGADEYQEDEDMDPLPSPVFATIDRLVQINSAITPLVHLLRQNLAALGDSPGVPVFVLAVHRVFDRAHSAQVADLVPRPIRYRLPSLHTTIIGVL